MRTHLFKRALVAGCALLAACSEATIPDLNNPTEDQYEVITSRAQLQALATGLVDGDRSSHGTQIIFFETIGRNLIRIDPAESRYVTRLLGASLSNSDFIGNGVWTAPYRTIRGADILIRAVTESQSATPTPLTPSEKSASIGFARTVKAMQYMRLIETRDTLGIAIETRPDTIVPLRCKPAALAYIAALLDSAATDLKAGGTAFPFVLPPGFTGVAGTPLGMLKFNRGLKAKIEMYRGFLPLRTTGPTGTPDATALGRALSALDSSFYAPTTSRAGLDVGVYHTYSTSSGDVSNPLFNLGVFRANRKVVSEGAEAGDLRIQAKVDTASSNRTLTGGGSRPISSNYILKQPASPTSPIAVLRNEELMLVRAEILWGLGPTRDLETLDLVNQVRASAGLPPRTPADFGGLVTAADRANLLRAILKEKRYSLLFESAARVIDYRMFGIINELGLERGFNPIRVLPIPNNESVARSGQLACVP